MMPSIDNQDELPCENVDNDDKEYTNSSMMNENLRRARKEIVEYMHKECAYINTSMNEELLFTKENYIANF